MCLQEAMFLEKLITIMYEQKDVNLSAKIRIDNQGALALAKNPIQQQRSKHIKSESLLKRYCVQGHSGTLLCTIK